MTELLRTCPHFKKSFGGLGGCQLSFCVGTYFQASPKLFHRTHTYILILGFFVQGVRSSVQSDVKSHTTNKINSHSSHHFFLRIITNHCHPSNHCQTVTELVRALNISTGGSTLNQVVKKWRRSNHIGNDLNEKGQ